MTGRLKTIGFICFSILVSSLAATAQDLADPRYRRDVFKFEGRKRSTVLFVPQSYDGSRAVPLLFALHGGGGDASDMVKLTKGGFNDLAERHGFIVAYAEGVEKHWNDGRGNDYLAQKENINDVGFISALIDRLGTQLRIDGARVYCTGISNGGMMSYRLGCELSHQLAAIAPVAASYAENLKDSCHPVRPVSAIIICGKDDPLVPWAGGEVTDPLFKSQLGRVIGVKAAAALFAANCGHTGPPVVTPLPNTALFDGTTVDRLTYPGCTGGSEVVLYRVNGGGHTWPSGVQYLPAIIVGRTTRDISANDLIWEFFSRHRR